MLLKTFVCLSLHIHLTVTHFGWFKTAYIHPFLTPDGFDVTKIRILEPPSTRKVAQAIGASTNSREEVPADILNKTEAISRKRPFENVDDSSVHQEQQQPPRKKTRIERHPREKAQPSARDIQVPRFTIFPKHSGKASRAISKRFLSRIRHTTADEHSDIS